MERNKLEEENLKLKEIVKLQDQRLQEKVHDDHDDHDRDLYSHKQKDPDDIDSKSVDFSYISLDICTIKADHNLNSAGLFQK